MILTIACYKLSDTEKQLLSKELNFSIPPKNVNYSGYVLPFELLCRDLNDIMTTDNREFIKTRLKDCAFSTSEQCKQSNLSLEELIALKIYLRRKTPLFRKQADKGKTVIIVKGELTSKKFSW